MQSQVQVQEDAVSRLAELKAHEKVCSEKLESLNRMLNRLNPSDHLYGGVVRSIARWSREQIETSNALWDALSDMNQSATVARASHGRHLYLVK